MVRESYGKLPAPTKTSKCFLTPGPAPNSSTNSTSRIFPPTRLIPRPTVVSYDRKSGEIKCLNRVETTTQNYGRAPSSLSPNSDGPEDGPNPFAATKRFFSFRNQASIINTTNAVAARKSSTLNNNGSPSKNLYQPQQSNGATYSKNSKNNDKTNFFSYNIPNGLVTPGIGTASKKLSWSSIKKPLILFAGQTTKFKHANVQISPSNKSGNTSILFKTRSSNGGENDEHTCQNDGQSPLNRWRNPKLRYNAPKDFNLPPSPKSPQQLSYAGILSQMRQSPENDSSFKDHQSGGKNLRNGVPQTPDLRKRALLSDILLNLPPPPSLPPSPPQLEEEVFEKSSTSRAKAPTQSQPKIIHRDFKTSYIPSTPRSKSDLGKSPNIQAQRPNLINLRLKPCSSSSIPLPVSSKATAKLECDNFEDSTLGCKVRTDPDAHYHSVSLFDSGVSSCSPPSTLDACVDTKELEQLCNGAERLERSEKVETKMPEVCDKVRSILHLKEANGYSMTDIMELLERQNELLIKARHEKDALIQTYENRIAELEATIGTSMNRQSTNFYFEHQTQKSKNNLNHHLYFLHTSLDTLFNQMSKSFQKYMQLENQNYQLTNVIKGFDCTSIKYDEESDFGKPQLFNECDTFHNDIISEYDFMS